MTNDAPLTPAPDLTVTDFYTRIGGKDYLKLCLSTEEFSALSGISVRTLEYWRAQGRGPVFVQEDSHKLVRYLVSDVVEFLAKYRKATRRPDPILLGGVDKTRWNGEAIAIEQ